ncbi:MAG: hypothetical protein IJI36_19040 [Kiritimatiellae bacterium]|nr:hypothetical protein [Kiritimatiellia bacterium]
MIEIAKAAKRLVLVVLWCAVAACAALPLAAGATPTVVPEGETYITNVTGNVTLEGQWIIGGTLCKIGGGTLTIPAEKVWFAGGGRLDALDGAVAVTSTTGEMDAYEEPAVAQAAAFWVKAGVNYVYDDANNLVRWLDKRDSTANATPSYVFAKSMTNVSTNAKFPTARTDDGYPSVSFGNLGSGQWMYWRKPDDSDAAWIDIANAFVAYNPVDTHGHFFGVVRAYDGNNASKYQQHFAVNNGLPDSTLFAGVYNTNPWSYSRIRLGRVFLDGVRVQPSCTVSFNTRQVIETEAGNDLPGAESFFNFRNYQQSAGSSSNGDRVGGGRLHEVLVFTNKLEETDRLLVEAYLIRNWVSGALRPPSVVSVADGATLTTPANYLSSAAIRANGGIATQSFASGYKGDAFVIAPPQVTAVAGDSFVNRANLPVADAPGLSLAVDSNRNTTVTAGTAGVMAKTGDGDMILAAKTNATRLAVSGGTVAFMSDDHQPYSIPSTNANCAVDGGFEVGMNSGSGGTDSVATGGKIGAWTSESVDASSVRVTANGEWANRLGDGIAPEGTHYLHLKQRGGVSQEMDLPHGGRYEVTFRTVTRQDGSSYAGALSVKVDGYLLACVPTVSQHKWERWRFVTPYLTAGKHTLRLAHELKGDKSSGIDDVRVVWRDGVRTVPIPNGNFESPVWGSGGNVNAYADLTTTAFTGARLTGWTCGDTNLVRLSRHATLLTSQGSVSAPAPVDGGIFNVLLKGAGAITNTFTVAESGVYRFSAQFAKCGEDGALLLNSLSVDVIVTINGEAETLGVSTFAFRRMYGTKRFSLNAGDTVTLAIASGGSGCRIAVDDVEFARSEGGVNLLRNPSFEEGSNDHHRIGLWDISPNAYSTNATWYTTYTRSTYFDKNFGSSRVDGVNILRLKNRRRASQTVTLPEAGLYRLSFWARSRIDERNATAVVGWGPNDLDVSAVLDGVTKELGRTLVSRTSTEFIRHEYFFVSERAGAVCQIVFQGVAADTDDKSSFIDAVSLVRVGGAESAPPLAAKSELTVASGAKLALNYVGTQTVERVSLGGRSYVGDLTAAVPDFLEGVGTLFSLPKGTMVIFR